MENKSDVLYSKKGGLTKSGEMKIIEKLSKELIFDQRELRRIINIFKKYVKSSWYMDIPMFSEVLHKSFGFTDNFFMKRIFYAADVNKDNRIDVEEFIRILAIMLHGTMEDKIKLCFSCYDVSENMELTRDDMNSLLLEAVSEPPTKDANDDALRDLVEMIFSKLDEDGTGVISYDQFQRACLKDWILMEAFGQCLPDHWHRAAFLVLLETDQEMA